MNAARYEGKARCVYEDVLWTYGSSVSLPYLVVALRELSSVSDVI
ncbi:hypothetical protein LJR034_004049 [Caballeronia sp. LjRoot34]